MEEEAEKLKKLQSQVDQEMSNTPVLSSPNCSKTSMFNFFTQYFNTYVNLFYFHDTLKCYPQKALHYCLIAVLLFNFEVKN